MATVKLKKINDVAVKAIKTEEFDTRPIRGKDVCSSCYSNIFLVAPTASGKTTTMFEIIKRCAGKKTKIIAFVSTIYNDESWHTIKEWCRKRKISFTGYTSIFEGKKDLLNEYVETLTKQAEEREKTKNKPIDIYESCLMFDNYDEDEEDEEDDKYQYPKHIFIFDDLSQEIRATSYEALLKKARHFGILTISSSQDLKDIKPATRNQVRVWLLFKNLNEERLKTIYDAISCNLSYELFKKMYNYSTKEKYHFFYISHRDCDFRKDFSTKFIL
jgi:hypothetical protein